MNGRIIRLALTAGTIALLPACQSFVSGGRDISASAVEDVDLGQYFDQRLAEGRRHLLANRPAAAIAAYRQASYDAELRGEAYNGMAIAFDRIGRPDLAQRYFMAAISLQPDNVSFASNFVRFSEARAEADTAAEAIAQAEAESLLFGQAIPEQAEGGELADVDAPSGSLVRVSEHEVRITAAENAGSEVRQPVQVHGGPSATGSANGVAENQEYPIRIALRRTSDAPDEIAAAAPESSERRTTVRRVRARGPSAALHRRYPIRVAIRSS